MVLDRFSPATREWFDGAFPRPTPAQLGAWDAVSSGAHALVVAPTGSGKTLAAFLWAIDQLIGDAPAREPEAPHPRALHLPAQGPRRRRRAQPAVPARGRDPDRQTPRGARARGDGGCAIGRHHGRRPSRARANAPDILITTPESLYLMLTSAARETLLGVETVIVDEVHAVAASKRGTHLAVSLERLDALLPKPAQRIGLSATVRPLEEVARFLGGRAPVTIVQPRCREDVRSEGRRPGRGHGGARHRETAPGRRGAGISADAPPGSIWPARRGADRRSDPRAPLHDRVRELAAARRAPRRPGSTRSTRSASTCSCIPKVPFPDRRARRGRRKRPERARSAGSRRCLRR